MDTLSPVSSQAPCAYVSSFRDSSRSKSSSSPSRSTLELPSIYVTFKVLQLVNAFRRRVTRKHTAQAATKKPSSGNTTEDFCQDFERQAFEEIDRYLGRKTKSPYGKHTKAATGTAKQFHTVATKNKPPGKSIEVLLQHLNKSIRFGEDSIDTVAESNNLFLRRQADLSIDRLTVKELCKALVTVKSLLQFLQGRNANPNICKGDELADCTIDTGAANLEHLVLRLEQELVRLLVGRLVELLHQHVSDCQKDQSKHHKEWFFEFPDARHPLSTTWPWSIKPSLAVIWGVCWMFYNPSTFASTTFDPTLFDREGNLLNAQGEIEVPAAQVYAWLSQQHQRGLPQHQQQQVQQMQPVDEHSSTGFAEVKEEEDDHMSAFVAASRQAPGAAHWPGNNPRFAPRTGPTSPSAEMARSTQPRMPRQAATPLSHSPQHQPIHHTGTTSQAPHTTHGLASAHTNNLPAYATQPPSTYVQDSAWTVPQESSANWAYANTYPTGNIDTTAWNQNVSVPYSAAPVAHSHYPGGQATLPPRSRFPSTPAIITTDLSQFHQQQLPQDFQQHFSATSASSNSSYPLRETTSYPNYPTSHFNSDHLSPHPNSPYMADTLPPPEVPEMQTTTPPRSPHEMQMSEQLTRKRSHSQISNGPPFQQPADTSHHGSQMGDQMGDEEFDHGRIHVNRPEPMMNSQRKYICNIGGEECILLTFDRKCEWSKHMDKHDRPYRCQDPGCAKLQGFTYSGGLLRHEREVHGKHGGPKAQLMCPYTNCKRHNGKGFTRKENLNEHIRRVHAKEQPPASQPDILKHDTGLEGFEGMEALAGAARAVDDNTETPASRVSEAVMVEDPDLHSHSPAAKRRRHNVQPGLPDHGAAASEDVEELRRQIEHLQQENAQKDQRLMDMERVIAEMDRKVQEQQMAQHQWHEHQQQAAALATAAQQASGGV